MVIIPNLDCLIPTPGNDNSTTGSIDIFTNADGSVVFCDLSGLTGLDVVHSAGVVGSR